MRSIRSVLLLFLAVSALLLWALKPAHASEREHVARGPIAVVDTFEVLEYMFEKPEYIEARQAMDAELEQRFSTLRDEALALQATLQGLDQTDPQFAQMSARMNELRQRAQQLDTQSRQDADLLTAQQLVEVFRLIRESSVDVGKDMGYTMVISSRMDFTNIPAQNPSLVAQELLARPVLMVPDEDNITEDVIKAMGLSDIAAKKRAEREALKNGAAPAAPAAAPAAGNTDENDG